MRNFKSTKVLIFLNVLTYGLIKGQSDHTLQLYDGPINRPGSWILINNYVDNLQNYAFNDLSSSFCVVRGIWLMYENPSYNSNFLGSLAFYWGENYCQDLTSTLNNQVSSVRYAGSPYSFQADALNIYQVEWFQSFEAFTASDSLDLSSYYGGSLIVTGRSYWTIYDSPNYQGYHVCVTPADITYAYPGFFTQASEFGFSGRVHVGAAGQKKCSDQHLLCSLSRYSSDTESGKYLQISLLVLILTAINFDVSKSLLFPTH